MATEIIVYDWKPSESSTIQASSEFQDALLKSSGPQVVPSSTNFTTGNQFTLDLYKDVPIPITYTITDIREPNKRQTPYSKTITIPGTKKNNRIFSHIWKIDAESTFNPNLKKQCVVQQDGIEVLSGTIQLKRIMPNGDYEIVLYGHLSNLFYDMGESKLSDLDFSEYSHPWTLDTITKSWDQSIIKRGAVVNNFVNGTTRTLSQMNYGELGRVEFTTTSGHGFQVGDYVQVFNSDDRLNGVHIVTKIYSGTKFQINFKYPVSMSQGTITGSIRKHTPTGEGYVYPIVNYGRSNGDYYDVEDLLPSLYIKTIVDKIFQTANCTYESNFFNSDFFKHLIFVYSKQEGRIQLSTNELNRRAFRARTTATFSYGISDVTGPVYAPTINLPITDDGSNGTSGQNSQMFDPSQVFNTSDYRWRPNENGRYKVIGNFTLDSYFQLGETITINGTNNSFFYWQGSDPGQAPGPNSRNIGYVSFQWYVKRGGIDQPLGSPTNVQFSTVEFIRANGTYSTGLQYYMPAQKVTVECEADFVKTDEVFLVIKTWKTRSGSSLFTQLRYVTGPSGQRIIWAPVRGTQTIRIYPNGIVYNFPSDFAIEGGTVNPSVMMPTTMTCNDFLTSLMKMFNLYVEEDRNTPRKYIIEPRDDYFYVNQYVDWTKKVDIMTMTQIPMGDLLAKKYVFKYKDDTDYYNKLYKDAQSESYGQITVDIPNDFLKNTITIETGFAPTPLVNLPKSSGQNRNDTIVPRIVNSTGTDAFEPVQHVPRILHYTGKKPIDQPLKIQSKFTTIADRASYNFYPFAGNVDYAADPYYDLNFYYTKQVYYDYAVWSNWNLYNTFYRKMIEEISDRGSRVVTFDVYLTPNDIRNLDFRKIYTIDNVYYRLNKIIDYDASARGRLTKVEMSKFKTKAKWSRNSLWSGGGSDVYFDVITNYERGIVTKVFERPPLKDPGVVASDNNTINPTTISNIRPVGRNNILGSNLRNVRIQGDENSIAAGSVNVFIQNGNGNSVAGNVQNVTLIGTDKVFVNESNVTYINNVRYVLGVPVSRSNVIDGGQDVAYKRNGPNTVINRIDAGENIVLPSGSQTYEQQIDAGSDRVLPDLPDYGITNRNAAISQVMPVNPAPISVGVTYSTRDQAIEIRINEGITSQI